MQKNNNFSLSTTHIIMLSFLGAILLGSLFLALPISSSDGVPVPYVDALFTATTSVCVTGLVTMPTVTTWSIFGQVVILLLIQVGGLGIITVMSGLMMLLNRKMGVTDRLLIQDAFNLNTMSGLAGFVKKVLFGTLIIEGIGALLYMFVFVPEFGARGIWISVFNSVSAFCNAGIDIIATDSLCSYATNPLVNVVTSLLIVLGGIGYIVWWDVVRVLKTRTSKNRKVLRHLTLHTKIAVFTTLILIFGGAICIFIAEYNNPLTIGDMSLFDKIQVSMFQSITSRTAGFATVAQENLTNAASVITLVLMFIGGSPVGTAGGVKTVTLAVLFSSSMATIMNKNEATLFRRTISAESVRKASAVVMFFSGVAITSALLLSFVTNAPALDIVFEVLSATATVGLSRNLTASLDVIAKIIIIFTMYFGRVGPISFAIALGSKQKSQNVISDPEEDVSIG